MISIQAVTLLLVRPLTTSIDNFTGTTFNDTFNATLGGANGDLNTLNALDSLNGAGGTDTLNAQIRTAVTPAHLDNIEILNATFSGDVVLGLDNAGQLTNVTNVGSTTAGTFNNIVAGAALAVDGTNQNTTFNFATTQGTQSAQLTLTNVTGGTETIAGVETINLVSAGSSNSATLAADAASTVNVSGSTNLTLDTTGSVALTKLDASTATGKISATLGQSTGVASTTNVSVIGGSADDTLTTSSVSQNLSVNGGAGNDTIIDTAVTATDSIDGGSGTADTLSTTMARVDVLDASARTTFTNLEVLNISDAYTGGTVGLTNIGSSFNTVNFATTAGDFVTGDTTVTGPAGTLTVNLGGSKASNATKLDATLTFTDTGTATTDSVVVNNTAVNSTTNVNYNIFKDGNNDDLATVGYENLTFNTGSANGSGITQTFDDVLIQADSASANTSVTFTGTNAVNVNDINVGVVGGSAGSSTGLLTVNASGLTAQATGTNTLTIDGLVLGSTGTVSVTGSAGEDSVTVAGNNSKATIDGGLGNDTIVGGTAIDSLLGGAGNDSIESGGGNDVIKGNEGVDTLKLTSTGIAASVDGGADNDVINVGNYIGKSQTLNGGAGVDTVAMSDTSLDAWASYSTAEKAALKGNIGAFEVLEITDATTNSVDVSTLVNTAEVTTVQFDAAVTGSGAWTNLASGSTAEFRAASNTMTLGVAGSGTSDVLTLKLNANTAGSTDFGTITTTGVETVNVQSTTRQSTASSATNTVTVSNANLTASNITGGSNTVVTYAAATGLASIDATAATGTVNISATAATTGTTILAGSGATTVASGSGADSIVGGAANDSITSNTGSDTILGGAGEDTIDGGAGADSINGGADNDTIVTSSGADTIDGGTGTDTLSVSTLNTNLTGYTLSNLENLDLNSNQVTLSIAQYNGFSTFADVSAGVKFNDAGTATANTTNLTKYVLANGVNNFTANGNLAYNVNGSAATTAAQTINFDGQYLTNDDTIVGGGGTSDYLYVTGNNAVDTAPSGVSASSSNISAVEYIVFGNTSTNITLAAFDAQATSGYLTIDATNQSSGNTSITTAAAGSAQDYKILLSAGTNSINAATVYSTGNTSDMSIVGGVGNDSVTVTAGYGIDYIDFTAGGVDAVTGISGTTTSADTVVAGATGTITIGVTADWQASSSTSNDGATVTINAASGIDVNMDAAVGDTGYTINAATSGSTAQELIGSDFADIISGGSGADTLSGGAGGDTVNGGVGADTITGGAGDDELTAGAGADILYGDNNGAKAAYAQATISAGSAGTITAVTISFAGVTATAGSLTVDATSASAVATAYADLVNNSVLKSVLSVTIDSAKLTFTSLIDGAVAAAPSLSQTGGTITLPTITQATAGTAGASGQDTLIGGADTDVLFGAGGNDQYDISAGASSGGNDRVNLLTTQALNGVDNIDGFTFGNIASVTGADVVTFNFGVGSSALSQSGLRGDGTDLQIASATNATLDANAGFVVYTAANVSNAAAAELAAEGLQGENQGDLLYFLTSTNTSASATATLYLVSYAGTGDASVSEIATFDAVTLTGVHVSNFTNFIAA